MPSEEVEEPFDASDEQQVRRRKSKADRRRESNRLVLAGILGTQDGRAWLWGILNDCHVFHSGFDPDARHAAFMEGERAVGMRILTEAMRVDVKRFVEMLEEKGGDV